MAGFFISKFDWEPFVDLVANVQSGAHRRLSEELISLDVARLGPFTELSQSKEGLTEQLREMLLADEWYAQRKPEESLGITRLLSLLFRPGGPGDLNVEPVSDGVAFEIVQLIAGRMEIDEQRTDGASAFYRILPDAAPKTKELHWLGNRPFRHGQWDGSNISQLEFEEICQSSPYSIHSPEQVDILRKDVASEEQQFSESPLAEVKVSYQCLAKAIAAAWESGQALHVVSDY